MNATLTWRFESWQQFGVPEWRKWLADEESMLDRERLLWMTKPGQRQDIAQCSGEDNPGGIGSLVISRCALFLSVVLGLFPRTLEGAIVTAPSP